MSWDCPNCGQKNSDTYYGNLCGRCEQNTGPVPPSHKDDVFPFDLKGAFLSFRDLIEKLVEVKAAVVMINTADLYQFFKAAKAYSDDPQLVRLTEFGFTILTHHSIIFTFQALPFIQKGQCVAPEKLEVNNFNGVLDSVPVYDPISPYWSPNPG